MNMLDFLSGWADVNTAQPSPILVRGISRRILAQALAQCGLNTGVEVGVAEGIHAEMLLHANPRLALHGVDCYMQYEGYAEYPDPEHTYRAAARRLERYMDRFMFVQKMSLDAAADCDDGYFDFVYLDAAHDYASVSADLAAWTPKVRAGGVVFGHDYKHHTAGRRHRHTVEVKPAVDEFCKGREPWFVLANDLEPDNPGWLFVK